MMEIGLGHYLAVAGIMFTIGVFGIFVNRKNVIIILMSIELMLNAVNISFVAFGSDLNDVGGQNAVFFVLVVAAVEVVVGLALVVAITRRRADATADDLSVLRG